MPNHLRLQPGLLAMSGALTAATHRHHAIQVIWPASGGVVRVDDCEATAPVVIGPGVEHQLDVPGGWLFLVEPHSGLGVGLKRFLDTLRFRIINALPPFESPSTEADSERVVLALLLSHLEVDRNQLHDGNGTITDMRIRGLLTRLDRCFGNECLKPVQWRAAEVASELALSESRFLHLFRAQVGVAWRPYLLWRRLLCAAEAVNAGCSATAAAHQAGFSDSAHLSRTFRAMFGMSIREAVAQFR